MQSNNIIPIVLIADKNYVMPVCVLLQSLYYNKNEISLYDIYVITDDIDKDSVSTIKQMSKENFNINVIEVDNKYKDLVNKNRTVTNAAFLKFDIASVVSKYDKVLYLDVDTIVLKDLSELYNTDLQETYCGVVEDYHLVRFADMNKKLSLKHYFNSGVLLLNTKKIREENLCSKMLKTYIDNGANFYHHDQDVLNLVFNDNITILHPKYNWMISNLDYPQLMVEKFYKISRQEHQINKLGIIHYVRLKPWDYSSVLYQQIWQKYYNLCNFEEKLTLKTCILMNIYYFLRGRLMLKKINKFFAQLKQEKKEAKHADQS